PTSTYPINSRKWGESEKLLFVGFTGAAAIATQSASKELRIRGKAGDYSQVEAELIILEYQVPKAKTLEEIQTLEEKLHQQRRKIAEIESKE
ncbi:hypothetical protein, partial [Dolichospermum sp. UHCC 0259]|uniref:hypothetical protein n=1 Tax=Dolichospermum sp. UHCC 0259 TaxID=2590010 RepID=UPI001447629D